MSRVTVIVVLSLFFLAITSEIQDPTSAQPLCFPLFCVGRVVVARQEVPAQPGPVNLQASEGTVAAGAAPLTHSHAAGWLYSFEGVHALTISGRTEIGGLRGRWLWIPQGVEHTHEWGGCCQDDKIWFVAVGSSLAREELHPGLRVLVVADPATELMGKVLEVCLIEFRFASAPERTGGVSFVFRADLYNVPGVLLVVSGTVRYGEDVVLRAGDIVPLRPPVRFLRNVPEQFGLIFHISLHPKP